MGHGPLARRDDVLRFLGVGVGVGVGEGAPVGR
jgi:hypothetical protein